MANQPKWRRVANLGDANFADYGGTLVFRDTTGVYGFEAEHYEAGETEEDTGQVYRYILDKCTYTDGILSDNPYHTDSPAWFADSVESCAATAGIEAAELIRLLCSNEPLELAIGYEAIAANHGHINLDNYPLELTRVQANWRYRHVK